MKREKDKLEKRRAEEIRVKEYVAEKRKLLETAQLESSSTSEAESDMETSTHGHRRASAAKFTKKVPRSL